LGSLIAFLANFYLSTKIGPKDFGMFKTVIYLFTFLPALANLGMHTALPKYIAEFRAKNKEKIGHLVMWFMKTRFWIFLGIGLLIFFFSNQISTYLFSSQQYSILIFAGLLIFFSYYISIFPYIVQGYQNFKLFSITLFLAYALPPIVAIMFTSFGLFYMILGFGLATAVSYVVTIKFLFQEKVFSDKISFDKKKIIVSFALPMYFLSIVTALTSLSVPFFSLFFNQETIGYLSFSLMFFTASLLIPNIFGFIVLPKTSELESLKKHESAFKLLRKVCLFYTPIVLIATLGILLLSGFFLDLIAPQYFPSLTLFKTLIIFGLFSGYGLIYAAYLIGKGNIKKTAIIVLSLNIILFLIIWIILSNLNI